MRNNMYIKEVVRVFVFLSILICLIVFKWYLLIPLILFYPFIGKLIRKCKHGNRLNIGYLVNYITDCIWRNNT